MKMGFISKKIPIYPYEWNFTENNTFSYRITKYDPQYRHEEGWFVRDDWTHVCDIGKVHLGKVVTVEDYLKVEDAYVNAIILFMDFLKLSYLNFIGGSSDKFRSPIPLTDSMLEIHKKSYVGMRVNKKKIDDVVRLILRNELCGRLVRPNMFVHLSGDYYYMYIGTLKEPPVQLLNAITQSGLFPEYFLSPDMHSLDEYDDDDIEKFYVLKE